MSRSSARTCRARSRSARATCTATATSSWWCASGRTPTQEAALRELHRDLPHREGHWYRHLEGSYAVADDLRTVDGLGGSGSTSTTVHDEMTWSDHCNQPWTRWILREHGITLVGPCPVDLVDPVPDDVLRDSARAGLATLADDVLGVVPARASPGASATWSSRPAAASTPSAPAQVASKRDALRWAMMHGDPRWRPLLQQVLADRDRGLRPAGRSRARARWRPARDFAAYVAAVA